MSDPFVGQIKIFAGSFAPRSYAFCDGQLLPVSGNSALFSLLGTIYGGDGRTTFGLPDLRGRIPIHAGNGPGLSSRPLGQKSGQETVTVTTNQLPAHTHPYQASTASGGEVNPTGEVIGSGPSVKIFVEDAFDSTLAPASVTDTGGGAQHENFMPFLCVHFIIALFGIFPSRN